MLNIGFIGTGVIADMHADAIAKNPELTLAAISEINPQRGQEFAAARNCRFYTDYRKMLRKEQLDVVLVSLPHHLHYPAGMAVLKAGSHLFMEKPMANTLAECDRLIKKAESKNKKIMVGHSHQYFPAIRQAKRLVLEGQIGRLNLIVDTVFHYYNWENRMPWHLDPIQSGGGVLMNAGPHQIDRLLFLVDSHPTWVFATVRKNRPGIDIDSDTTAHITFENGMTATLVICQSYAPKTTETSIRLIGTEGMIEYYPWGNVQLAKGAETKEIVCDPANRFMDDEWLEFANAIREDRPPITDGRYGRTVLAVIDAIYKSSKKGKPIRVK